MSFSKSDNLDDNRATSLAADYVIHIQEDGSSTNSSSSSKIKSTWTLVPIQNVPISPPTSSSSSDDFEVAPAAMAIHALQASYDQEKMTKSGVIVMTCEGEHKFAEKHSELKVRVENDDVDESDELSKLLAILSRVMVQKVVSKNSIMGEDSGIDHIISMHLPSSENDMQMEELPITYLLNKDGCPSLYASMLPSTDGVEMSDMVDSNGSPLGSVPRPLMHTFNLLHRGIGMVVCCDEHIHQNCKKDNNNKNNKPSVYVHRRTDTKRIFPSLYDMFVGGVSVTGEDATLTAAREVAEELGLDKALLTLTNDKEEAKEMVLSEPLFKCTICTTYNRCVVTMFTYKYTSGGEERVQWQEEEVAWGDFVPYEIVEKAATLSILRMKNAGSWPYGTFFDEDGQDRQSLLFEANDDANDIDKSWQTWDFVPDGLLVWEAWLNWINKNDS